MAVDSMQLTSVVIVSGFLAGSLWAWEPSAPAPSGEAVQAQAGFENELRLGREALAAERMGEAETHFRRACPLPLQTTWTPSRAGLCFYHLGATAIKGTNPDAALELFRRAGEAWQAAGPDYAETWGYSVIILSDLYQRQHQPLRAEEVLVRYVASVRNRNAQKVEQYPEALSRLALAYADTGRAELAYGMAQDAVAAFSKLKTPKPGEAAYAYNTLGLISLSMGRQKDAEDQLQTALQLSIKELGEDNPDTAGYQTNLALVLLARGEADGAETLLRRARHVVERLPGASGNQLAMICAELSAVAVIRNKLALAGEEAKRALEILGREKWPDPKATALAQVNMANVHMHAGRLDEADLLLAEAIPTERRVAAESRLLADGIRRLAQLRAMQHRWRESQELYREAIRIYEMRVGGENPSIVPLLREYADALKREGGSKAEIRGVETRAKSILGFAPVRFTPTP